RVSSSPPPVPAVSSSSAGVDGDGVGSTSSSSACSHGTSTLTSPTYHGGSGPRLIHAASVAGASTVTGTVTVSPRWISTGLYCNPNSSPASGPLSISCSGVTPWLWPSWYSSTASWPSLSSGRSGNALSGCPACSPTR